jgi:hypothetical protein
MLLTTLALLATFAAADPHPQAAAAPPAPPKTGAAGPAMSVAVEVAPVAGAAGQQWGQELRTALEPRKDEFRPPRKGEKPELVVRIDSVAPAPKGGKVMTGALVEGTRVRVFNVTYPGDVRPQAEALSRNLRRLADQLKSAPPRSPKK